MNNFLVFIFSFFIFGEILGQENFQFQHYGVEDGLSQSRIEALFQDSRGYLWIGTTKGLNKFNGSTFEIFTPSLDSTKSSIAHQSVYAITEDRNGNIWAGTRNGVSKYNPQNKQFTNFTKVGDCEDCLAGSITKTFFEHPPYMYVGSNAGLSRIHTETGAVKGWWHTENTQNIPDIYSIRDIKKLDNGELMLATHDGLVFYNIEKDEFRLVNQKDGLPDPGNGIQKLHRDSKGNYWLAMASGGVVRIIGEPSDPTFEQLPMQEPDGIPSATVYDIIEYPKGILWFASHEGIVRYDYQNNTYKYIKKRVGDALSITANDITHLLVDKENRIWLGSGFGLDVYDPYLNQFEMLTAANDKTKGLAANNTSAIFEDSQGAVWIGNVENGVTVLQQKNGVETFHHITAGKNKLPHPVIYGIGEHYKGRIYIATGAGAVQINWPDRSNFNYTIEKIPVGEVSQNKLPTPSVYTFKEDNNDALWLPTHGKGVIKIDKEGNFTQYINENQDPKLQSSDFVVNLTVDTEGNVWTANSGTGFGIINTKINDTVVRKFPAKNPFTRMPTNNVVIHNNHIFFNTQSGSYYYQNKEELLKEGNPEYHHYTEENGLSDITVNKLIPVSDSIYWASTGNGLSRLSTVSKKATSYKYIAGAKNVEFLRNSGTMTRDSVIYFGSINGVVRFKPRHLKENTIVPQVYFSDLKIVNKPVLISEKKSKKTTLSKSLEFLDKIQLKPADKIISISLSALNFTLPIETTYAYKLEGFEEVWTTTKNPIITRTNLDPGNYTLLAKASNNEGFWSEPVSLKIEMLPPWYRKWWAYCLFGLILIGSIYLLLKLRLQQERQLELARAQERDIFRKRSSRDFHDEAGTKMTRIALVTELAKLNAQNNPKMQEYLSQIEDNLQELNSGMRDFIWTLDPSKDNVNATLNRFTDFAGKFCECAAVQFRSDNIPKGLASRELNMAERRHLLLILKEALNNSIKHGNPSEIQFEVNVKPGKLNLTLRDNGEGFDYEFVQNQGNGLVNMKERAQALGGIFKLQSIENEGTTLYLSLETTRLGNG